MNKSKRPYFHNFRFDFDDGASFGAFEILFN